VHTYHLGAGAAAVLVHDTVPCGVALDALSANGRSIHSGELTEAGFFVPQAHGQGELPLVPRNPETSLNNAGQALLDDILTDPHSQFTQFPDGDSGSLATASLILGGDRVRVRTTSSE